MAPLAPELSFPGAGGPTVPATIRNVAKKFPDLSTGVAVSAGTEHPTGSVSVVVFFPRGTVAVIVGSAVPLVTTLHSTIQGREWGTNPVPSTMGAVKGLVTGNPPAGTVEGSKEIDGVAPDFALATTEAPNNVPPATIATMLHMTSRRPIDVGPLTIPPPSARHATACSESGLGAGPSPAPKP